MGLSNRHHSGPLRDRLSLELAPGVGIEPPEGGLRFAVVYFSIMAFFLFKITSRDTEHMQQMTGDSHKVPHLS